MTEFDKISDSYPNASRLVEGLTKMLKVLRPHMDDIKDIQKFMSSVSLSPRHRHMILHLAVNGSLSVSELSARLGTSLTSTSQSVTHLAELKIAERKEDPTDHRRTLVSLSGPVAQVSRSIVDGRFGPLEKVISQFDPQDIAKMLETLEAVGSSMEDALATDSERAVSSLNYDQLTEDNFQKLFSQDSPREGVTSE